MYSPVTLAESAQRRTHLTKVSYSQFLCRAGYEFLIIIAVLNAVSTTGANVAQMKSKLDRDEDIEILNWLTLVDYSPQQSDYIRRRQAGSGQWLLDSEEFQRWYKTE